MRSNVLKSTIIVFVVSLIAKLIAFLKSIFQAYMFGASVETDAFNVSSGFVNNVLYMFTTSIAVAFVPLYIQHRNKNAKVFATKIITALFLVALIITLGLIIVAPVIVKIIAPSYSGSTFNETIQYFRILCLGFSFSLIANMYTNLLNAEKVYGYSAIGSIINSLVLILLIFILSDILGVWVLVISVPISYFIQWIILYIRGKKYAKISVKYGIKDNDLKILVIQAFPILLCQATVEINQVVDRALITSLGAGALTAVSYSAILYQFASTLISTPLSTVMFTELSEAGAKREMFSIGKILNSCYKILFIVCLPIMIIIFFSSIDIVEIVYGHGNFTSDAVSQCALGLRMYGFCLLPVCLKSVLSRAYYGLNDTKKPMIFGVFEVILNIVLSVALYKSLGIAGVVGSTAVASIVFIIIMTIDFNRQYVTVITLAVLKNYWKILVSTSMLLIFMISTEQLFLFNYLIDFTVKSMIGISIYIFTMFILKDSTIILIVKKSKNVIKNNIIRKRKY